MLHRRGGGRQAHASLVLARHGRRSYYTLVRMRTRPPQCGLTEIRWVGELKKSGGSNGSCCSNEIYTHTSSRWESMTTGDCGVISSLTNLAECPKQRALSPLPITSAHRQPLLQQHCLSAVEESARVRSQEDVF